MEHAVIFYIVNYLIAAVAIFSINYFLDKKSVLLNILLYGGLVVIMTLQWILFGNAEKFSWFVIAKFYSVFFPAILVFIMRFTGDKPVYGKIMYVILALNILEASVRDFTSGSLINGAMGLIIIAFQPSFKKFHISSDRKNALYDTSWNWIIAYTIWNFAFCYGQATDVNGTMILLALLHLGLPLIFCYRNPALYLQHRITILSLSVFAGISMFSREYIVYRGNLINENIWYILIGLSVLSVLFLLIIPFVQSKINANNDNKIIAKG